MRFQGLLCQFEGEPICCGAVGPSHSNPARSLRLQKQNRIGVSLNQDSKRKFRLIFLATLCFLLLSHGGHFYAIDNFRVYETARALMEKGSLAVPPGLGTAPGRGGKSYARWSIGLSLLEIPLIGPASVLDKAWPDKFAAIVGPNASVFYPEDFSVFAASLVSPIFAALAAAVFWSIAELLDYPSSIAASLTAMLLLSTQFWPAARDTFPHIVVACLLLALFRQVVRWNARRTPLMLGCISGLLILVRPFDAFLTLPLLTSYVFWQDRKLVWFERRFLFSEFGLYLFPCLIAVFIIGLQNDLRFESPLIFNEGVGFNNPILDGLWGLLFSIRRGVIFFSPPVFATLFGLVFLVRRKPAPTVLLAALIASFLVGYATCPQWHGSLCWGPRYIVPIIPFATLPLGELILRKGISRVSVLVLAAAGFLVQIGATVVDFQRAAIGVAPFFSDPGYSQIWGHWRNLLADKFLDWMPLRLYSTHGLGAAIAYSVAPIALSVWAIMSLAKLIHAESRLESRQKGISAAL